MLGVELGVRQVFATPVLRDMARALSKAQASVLPPVERADRSRPLPLSFMQQRLWFLDKLEGGGAAYHIPGALRLNGRLDRVAFRRALDAIVARHEALRTRFVERDGEAVQEIVPVAVRLAGAGQPAFFAGVVFFVTFIEAIAFAFGEGVFVVRVFFGALVEAILGGSFVKHEALGFARGAGAHAGALRGAVQGVLAAPSAAVVVVVVVVIV